MIQIGFLLLLTLASTGVDAKPACRVTLRLDELTSTYCIQLADRPHWTAGGKLQIAPTRAEDGAIYIPYDLTDAWRELSVMLPESYKKLVGLPLAGGCHQPELLSETQYELHSQLWYFIQTHWLAVPDARFREYFAVLLNVPEKSLDDEAAQGVLAGQVLCSFYRVYRDGTFPLLVPWLQILKGQLRSGYWSNPY